MQNAFLSLEKRGSLCSPTLRDQLTTKDTTRRWKLNDFWAYLYLGTKVRYLLINFACKSCLMNQIETRRNGGCEEAFRREVRRKGDRDGGRPLCDRHLVRESSRDADHPYRSADGRGRIGDRQDNAIPRRSLCIIPLQLSKTAASSPSSLSSRSLYYSYLGYSYAITTYLLLLLGYLYKRVSLLRLSSRLPLRFFCVLRSVL